LILDYTRCKHASIAELEESSLLVRVAVEDTFYAAEVEMVVGLPALEVTSIKGKVKRAFSDKCQQAVPLLNEVVGMRVGSGIIKAVNDLVGGPSGCPRLADLILEGFNDVILRYTMPPLREIVPLAGQAQLEAYQVYLRKSPRLVGSCIAFAEGSPYREGLEV